MNPGTYNRLARLQRRKVVGRGDHGTPEYEWNDESQLWCSVEPLSGNERMRNAQVLPTISHRVLSRFIGGVDTGMRLLIGERPLYIESVINQEDRGATLEMLCAETPDIATEDNP